MIRRREFLRTAGMGAACMALAPLNSLSESLKTSGTFIPGNHRNPGSSGKVSDTGSDRHFVIINPKVRIYTRKP